MADKKQDDSGSSDGDALYELEVPHTCDGADSYGRFAWLQFIYSMAGLVVGLVCLGGGIVLFLNGIAGETSWTAKVIGLESDISDAAPGSLLFIAGVFIIFITRFSIKVRQPS